jgi:hypothetical protein
MVSWQRLLSGRFRDPLVGRDILLGISAGSATAAVFLCAVALLGISEASQVNTSFGHGLWPSVGFSVLLPSDACLEALLDLALLSLLTGLFRRRWLGLAATGLILVASFSPTSAADVVLSILYALIFLAVLTRLGLIAAVSFLVASHALAISPPLDLTQWYASRAMIALLVPLALLVFGFYTSLGGQPLFGTALREE